MPLCGIDIEVANLTDHFGSKNNRVSSIVFQNDPLTGPLARRNVFFSTAASQGFTNDGSELFLMKLKRIFSRFLPSSFSDYGPQLFFGINVPVKQLAAGPRMAGFDATAFLRWSRT